MLLGEFPSEVGDDNGNSPNYMGIPKWGWWWQWEFPKLHGNSQVGLVVTMGIPQTTWEFPSGAGGDNGNSPNNMGIPKWGWWWQWEFPKQHGNSQVGLVVTMGIPKVGWDGYGNSPCYNCEVGNSLVLLLSEVGMVPFIQ
jgi:hypothetical protein